MKNILLFIAWVCLPALSLAQTGGALTVTGSGVISQPVSGATFSSANGFLSASGLALTGSVTSSGTTTTFSQGTTGTGTLLTSDAIGSSVQAWSSALDTLATGDGSSLTGSAIGLSAGTLNDGSGHNIVYGYDGFQDSWGTYNGTEYDNFTIGGSMFVFPNSLSSGNSTVTLCTPDTNSWYFGAFSDDSFNIGQGGSDPTVSIAYGAPGSSLVIYNDGHVSINGGSSSLNALFDGTGGDVLLATSATYSSSDSFVLHGTDGSTTGIAAFQGDGSLAQAATTGTGSVVQASGATVSGITINGTTTVTGTTNMSGTVNFTGTVNLTGTTGKINGTIIPTTSNDTAATLAGTQTWTGPQTFTANGYYYRLASDQTQTGTTPTNTIMALSLPAGTYRYIMSATVTTVSTTGGIQCALQTINSGDVTDGNLLANTSLNGGPILYSTSATGSGQNIFTTFSGAPGTYCTGYSNGILTVGTTGTYTMKLYQRTILDGTNPAILKAGSFMYFERIR